MAGKDKRKEAKEGRVLPGSRPYVSDLWDIEKPATSWPKLESD